MPPELRDKRHRVYKLQEKLVTLSISQCHKGTTTNYVIANLAKSPTGRVILS